MDTKRFNQSIIEEFRANEGKVGGRFAQIPLLLLTTEGAKTARVRTNPLVYASKNDRYFVAASYAGAPTNPPWYYNLMANPDVQVEVGSERFRAQAKVLKEPERTERFEKMIEVLADFSEYQKKTIRVIPVIELTRR